MEKSSTPVFSSDLNIRSLGVLKLMLANSSSLQLADQDGHAVELSPVMVEAIQQIVRIMLLGKSAAILPYEQYLSCQESAELLGISRPYLYRLLDKGVIAYFRVGSHRRLKFEDVIDYKLSRVGGKHQTLLELAKLSEKLGLLLTDEPQ